MPIFRNQINRITLFFLFVFIAGPLRADETVRQDTLKIRYHLNPVLVTASKIPDARMDLAASISLIEGFTLDHAGSGSVLNTVAGHVPGFYLTEWGIMGYGVAGRSAGKIAMRGIGGGANTHTLILRNGRPDFMGLMGCTVADEFSSENVGRVEIVRGPGSFLYGTNATGGIINIISRTRTKPGFETRLSSSGGSFGTYELSAAHGGKAGAFDYYLTAATRKTDGHRTDGNATYEADHYTAHAGYGISFNTHVDLNINLAQINLNDPGPVSSPYTDHWYKMKRYGGDITLIHHSRFGDTHVKLHGNFGRHHFFDGWLSDDRILGLMVHQTVSPLAGNKTTLGFDIKEYGGSASDMAGDYGSHYLTEWAPYLHTQQLLFGRLILSAGIRLEHHDLFGSEMLPKAGLVFHPLTSTALRISVAKGFRSPSIRELYFWAPANETLGPDRFVNYEAGLTQRIGSQLLFEAVGFRTDGSNLIQFSGPPPRWINSGAYTQYGYELIADWTVLPGLQAGVSWTHIDLPDGAYNMPGKKLTGQVNAVFRRLTLHGNLMHIRDWKGAEWLEGPPVPVLHDMDSYTVVNLTFGLRIISALQLRINIKNVLDADYESMYGYPMPGITFTGGLTYGV